MTISKRELQILAQQKNQIEKNRAERIERELLAISKEEEKTAIGLWQRLKSLFRVP